MWFVLAFSEKGIRYSVKNGCSMTDGSHSAPGNGHTIREEQGDTVGVPGCGILTIALSDTPLFVQSHRGAQICRPRWCHWVCCLEDPRVLCKVSVPWRWRRPSQTQGLFHCSPPWVLCGGGEEKMAGSVPESPEEDWDTPDPPACSSPTEQSPEKGWMVLLPAIAQLQVLWLFFSSGINLKSAWALSNDGAYCLSTAICPSRKVTLLCNHRISHNRHQILGPWMSGIALRTSLSCFVSISVDQLVLLQQWIQTLPGGPAEPHPCRGIYRVSIPNQRRGWRDTCERHAAIRHADDGFIRNSSAQTDMHAAAAIFALFLLIYCLPTDL